MKTKVAKKTYEVLKVMTFALRANVITGIRLRAGASKACEGEASSTRRTSAAVQQSQRWAQSDTVVAHSDVTAFEVVLEVGGDGCGRWVRVRVEGELRSSP